MNIIKKAAFATALAATALTSAAPAMARDHYHRGGDRTGTAIGVGIVGLALGAIIASSANRNDRYRDNRYAVEGGYYARDGRYYDRDGRYYDRGDRYDRYDDRGYYDRRGYRGY
jgi:hypothetical protein